MGLHVIPRATLRLEPGTRSIVVREVWYDGTIGDGMAELEVTVPAAP